MSWTLADNGNHNLNVGNAGEVFAETRDQLLTNGYLGAVAQNQQGRKSRFILYFWDFNAEPVRWRFRPREFVDSPAFIRGRGYYPESTWREMGETGDNQRIFFIGKTETELQTALTNLRG